MGKMMSKFLLHVFINIRWTYFHINPMYIKFYVEVEPWFQHRTNGSIHCGYSILEKNDE